MLYWQLETGILLYKSRKKLCVRVRGPNRALLLVAAASVFTRLILQPITSSLSLSSRYELSSPMTSSSRLIEGVHLMSHHLDPYASRDFPSVCSDKFRPTRLRHR
jgi:hypothetical protein